MTSAALFGLATIALLVFIAILATRLRADADHGSPAPAIVLIGGATAAITATLGSLAIATLAYRVGAQGGTTARMLFDLQNLANASVGFGAIVFLAGVALGASRVSAFPAWLVPATWVVALAELVSIFQVFPKAGAFAPGGALTYAFFGLFMIWVLAVGVTMMRGLPAAGGQIVRPLDVSVPG